MILEYAVDPLLFADGERFRFIAQCFGVSNARVISRYPRRWERLVYDSLNTLGEVERNRVVEWLVSIKEQLIGRNHAWNPRLDWLSNAEAEHVERPFHAIVSATNPRTHEGVLAWDDINNTHPRWTVALAIDVAREANAMAQAVAPLLRASKEIVFIDPHFRPNEPRFRDPLKAFLEVAFSGRTQALERIFYYCNTNLSREFFESQCGRHLSQCIPQGSSVIFVRVSERAGSRRLHDRHILTNLGRVDFSVGLDAGEPGSTTHLYLTSETLRRELHEAYCSENIAFDAVDELIVHGTRPLV
ncbi:MAG: hypothetical protein HYX63_06975 [Gammaproteobacteria bacterium]|nr:hypothetical protein [Gammaproteobacteria bacterium]